MSRDLRLRPVFVALFLFIISSCNQFTYTPRSKAQVRREQPSILLLSRMIDYRIEQYGWPVSREDFVTKGKQYQEAFADFKYTFAEFKIVDTNTMFFYFSGHIEDQKRYDNSRKSDLNALGGHVKFFRVKDKFAWKIRMN